MDRVLSDCLLIRQFRTEDFFHAKNLGQHCHTGACFQGTLHFTCSLQQLSEQ